MSDVWRRRSDATRPLIYQGAPHSRRPPIGTQESLESFTHEALKRFYDDWYRPELMAVIVVGDMDPDDAQRRVERMFGDLVNGPDRPPRPHLAIPRHDETLMTVFTDPEMSYIMENVRPVSVTPTQTFCVTLFRNVNSPGTAISLRNRCRKTPSKPASAIHSK